MPIAYRFGRFEVFSDERRLMVDGERADVGARALDVLLSLIERRDRVVSKNELMDLVWPGLVVEENNLQVQVSSLRKLLGAQAIATVPGRGYRFTATVAATARSDVEPALAAPPSTSGGPGNLPAGPALIGREDDLANLMAQIERHPLVTLLGAAGVGKTALAVAAGWASSPSWRDGVWLVDLAPVTDHEWVPQAVAQTLGVALNGPDRAESLIAGVLHGRRLLILLDNCEHVIDAAASLAVAIAAHAPGIHLLATSQELLNVPGEKVVKLRPLAVAAADAAHRDARQCAAVRLFAERAQAVDPGFTLADDNVAVVAEICRRLDGLPLAIELAAARVRVLGATGVRDRLGERFRMLTGGARTAMRRHQTLAAALDWSYGLLARHEQRVLRRLGVFVGGFTLESAQRVAADRCADAWDVLDALGGLVDKSMLVAQGGDEPRYTLLETTRAYCMEKLVQEGEAVATMQRHAEAMQALYADAHSQHYGEHGTTSDAAYVACLRPELDNLRSAFQWVRSEAAAMDVWIDPAIALAEAARAAGMSAEGIAVLGGCVEGLRDASDDERTLGFLSSVLFVGRDRWPDDPAYSAALERSERIARARGDRPRLLYRILLEKAWWLMRRQRFDEARSALAQAAELEKPDWPAWLRSDRWNTLANLLTNTGEFDAAWAAHQTVERILPPRGEERRWARLTMNRGVVRNFQQRWTDALDLLEPLLGDDVLRRHPEQRGWALGHVILALTATGRLDDAAQRLRSAIPLWRADGVLNVMLYVAIRLVVAQGRAADALRLMGRERDLAQAHWKHELLKAHVLGEVRSVLESAIPDAKRQRRWFEEGASLGDDEIAALCIGAGQGTGVRELSER